MAKTLNPDLIELAEYTEKDNYHFSFAADPAGLIVLPDFSTQKIRQRKKSLGPLRAL